MTATFIEARDEIFGQFNDVWVPLGFLIAWPDVADDNVPPDVQNPWARPTLTHLLADQATLTDDTGGKRFRRLGFVTIQIFTPVGEGADRSYDLAQAVANAYQGKSTASAVWFRNVRINEIGIDGDWYQINVIADFEYDQFVAGL